MTKRIYVKPTVNMIEVEDCLLNQYSQIHVVNDSGTSLGGGWVIQDTDVEDVPEPNAKPWTFEVEEEMF